MGCVGKEGAFVLIVLALYDLPCKVAQEDHSVLMFRPRHPPVTVLKKLLARPASKTARACNAIQASQTPSKFTKNWSRAEAEIYSSCYIVRVLPASMKAMNPKSGLQNHTTRHEKTMCPTYESTC